MLALLIACASPPTVEDTAFSWPYSSDTASPGGLEGWEADRLVLSWQVEVQDGLPLPSLDNVLYITAADSTWDGDTQASVGHCTAQRSLAELEASDTLAADGATLLTLYSPPGGDVASLGDCARLVAEGWEGAPAQWMAEGLFGTDGWLLGVGQTKLFSEELGDLGAYALGGYARLDGAVLVTSAVFVIDVQTEEALPVADDAGLPDGVLIAPPWFALPEQ